MKKIISTHQRQFYYFIFIAFLLGCKNPDKSDNLKNKEIILVSIIDGDGNVLDTRMDTLTVKIKDNNKRPNYKIGNITYAKWKDIIVHDGPCGDGATEVTIDVEGTDVRACECPTGDDAILVKSEGEDEGTVKCVAGGLIPTPDPPDGGGTTGGGTGGGGGGALVTSRLKKNVQKSMMSV